MLNRYSNPSLQKIFNIDSKKLEGMDSTYSLERPKSIRSPICVASNSKTKEMETGKYSKTLQPKQ